MLISTLNEEAITPEIIDRVLYNGLEDDLHAADAIIVLGSRKAEIFRVPRAVEIYKAGRAGKIIMCGGGKRVTETGETTEAEVMKTTAMDMGVREQDILIDNQSENTIENMLYALIVLQKNLWLNRVKDVILTTASCHMRRSLMIAGYLFPSHIRIHPAPANDRTTRRDNWMHSEEGRKRTKEEVMNIITCVKNGVFPDFEI